MRISKGDDTFPNLGICDNTQFFDLILAVTDFQLQSMSLLNSRISIIEDKDVAVLFYSLTYEMLNGFPLLENGNASPFLVSGSGNTFSFSRTGNAIWVCFLRNRIRDINSRS